MRFSARIAVFVLSVCPLVASAGDLNPPPGPVQATMKSLDAIEPRVCLNDLQGDEGAVVLITEPGNYFMRADVRGVPGAHGVRIVTAGDVTIDLNGFSIVGVPGSLDGVNMCLPPGSSPSSLTVRGSDGSSRSMISGFSNTGIHSEGVVRCECTHLIVADNGGGGIVHVGSESVVHRDVATRNNIGDGVTIGAAVEGLRTGRRQHGLYRCSSSGNTGSGFTMILPRVGFEVIVDACDSSYNGGDGFRVTVSPDGNPPSVGGSGQGVCHFGRCFSLSNEADGVHIEVPVDSNSAFSATELSSIGNGGDGISVGPDVLGGIHFGHVTVLKSSEFSGNGGNGITSRNPLFVSGSTAKGNTRAGIHADGPAATELIARIEDCTLVRNHDNGVQIDRGRFSASQCVVSDTTGIGINCDDGCVVLQDCSVTRSTLCGVMVVGTLNATDCVFRRNDEAGCKVRLGSCIAENVVCEYNGIGAQFEDCTSVTLTRCVFNDNTSDGVRCSSAVGPVRWMSSGCVAMRNLRDGFDLNDCVGGHLDRCVSSGNGGVGFLLGGKFDRCRVEKCSASDNLGGEVFVLGSGNLVVGCRAAGNAVGTYDIAPGNVRAPVIDAVSIQQNCNPDANIIY